MRRTRADRESAVARRCAGLPALAACAMAFTAAGSFAEAFPPPVEEARSADSTTPKVIAQAAKPGTRDSLFEDDAPPAQKPQPTTRDSLFGDDAPPPAGKPQPGSACRGFIQGEVARAYRDPEHWSKLRLRADVTRQGQFSENVKWKIGGRADYDAAYDLLDFYAPDVRRDQRYEFTLRENYLDISTRGNWEI